MLTKVQLFDASRCLKNKDYSCKTCAMKTTEMACMKAVIDTAIELLKENEELKARLNKNEDGRVFVDFSNIYE